MQIYSLDKLPLGDNKMKRVLELSILEPNISILIKPPAKFAIYQGCLDTFQDFVDFEGSGIDHFNKVNYLHNAQAEATDYLALSYSDVRDMIGMTSTTNKCEITLANHFTALVRAYDSGLSNYVESDINIGMHGDEFKRQVFLLRKAEEKGTPFYYDELFNMPISFNNIYVLICPSTAIDYYKQELMGILGEGFSLPEFVQDKLKRLPYKFENRSERLDVLLQVYKSNWQKLKAIDNLNFDHKVIREKVKSQLKNELDALLSSGPKATSTSDDTAGVNLLKFCAKLIEPDFVNNKNVPDFISHGVPRKLWIILCASEYFWKEVDRGKVETHPVGTDIELFFSMMNNHHYLTEKFKKYRQSNKSYEHTKEMTVSGRLQEFTCKYPEVIDFTDITFSSSCSRSAATLIRPLWASARNKGGGYRDKVEETAEEREKRKQKEKEMTTYTSLFKYCQDLDD